MILLVDNYDSFTFNLVHLVGELGVHCDVRRNDAIDVDGALALRPEAIILSPGPRTPTEAGICVDLVTAAARHDVPLLGVCLGHQAIGQCFGGEVVRAPAPMHGKVDAMHHAGANDGLFAGVPSPFEATRYHSLVVRRETMPDELAVSAWTADGLVMGMFHRAHPIYGVQFHPESIASPAGRAIVANFLRAAGIAGVDAAA